MEFVSLRAGWQIYKEVHCSRTPRVMAAAAKRKINRTRALSAFQKRLILFLWALAMQLRRHKMVCQGTGMELRGTGNWPEESHLASWEGSRLLCQPLVPWWWSRWERDGGTEPRQAGVRASWQGLLLVWQRLSAVAGDAYEQCRWTYFDSCEALWRHRLLLLLLREVVIDVPPSLLF